MQNPTKQSIFKTIPLRRMAYDTVAECGHPSRLGSAVEIGAR